MRDPHPQRLAQIAEGFTSIASCVEHRKPDAALMKALEETRTLCAWVAPESSGTIRTLLTNVQTALSTWQQVWPRMGSQREFRQAVAREANLWSRRLQALVKGCSRD